MNKNPIGIFDSGIGGLSVLVEVRLLFPNEDIVYFADTKNCPYGVKPPDDIRRLAIDASEFLLYHRAKIIVVACNTVSAAALATLRSTFEIPFVGMVPGVKPATTVTRSGKVGVIATQATCQAELFAELVSQFASGIDVFTQPCPGLVELVESGDVDSAETDRLLLEYIGPLLDKGIDTLVLGCTHYPFLRPAIERLVGETVTVIDTGIPVARQVGRIIGLHDMASTRRSEGKVRLFTSGDLDGFVKTVTSLVGEAMNWEIIKK